MCFPSERKWNVEGCSGPTQQLWQGCGVSSHCKVTGPLGYRAGVLQNPAFLLMLYVIRILLWLPHRKRDLRRKDLCCCHSTVCCLALSLFRAFLLTSLCGFRAFPCPVRESVAFLLGLQLALEELL